MKPARRHLSKIITLVFLGVFAWYAAANREMFVDLGEVGLVSLILVALGRMTLYVSNGLFTKWSTEALSHKMSTGEGLYISILSAIGNFFGPLLGGTSIRAVYLKKVHGLSYSKFTASLMAYYIVLFTANCSLAIASILLLETTSQTAPLLLFFGAALCALLVLLFIRLPSWGRLNRYATRKVIRRVLDILLDIEQGWRLIQDNKKLLVRLLLLALLGFAANCFMAYVAFRAVGVAIAWPALGLYAVLVTVSVLLSFTPGAIGIRETLLILISVTLGVTNQEILQVAVIDRGVNFFLLFLLFLVTRSRRAKRFMSSPERETTSA